MESTKILAVTKFTLLIFLILVCSSWYSHVNLIEYKNQIDNNSIGDNTAIKLIQNYDADKTYYQVNRQFVKVERTVVPFMYKKTVLRNYPTKYQSR